ncbi:hypothetical protein [Roseivirga sp.]|uniref:hypothetical protein n=1 Tax=Roseivirga sp. TaxID=1964215 RepID=UPI003B530291
MSAKRLFELRRTRSFGQKLEGTFEFIRLNVKPLFKSLLFFSGPFALVGTFLVSNIFTASFAAGINANAGVDSSMNEVMSIGMSALGFMFMMAFAGAMIISTIYACVRCYEQNGSADYTTQDVWARVKKVYWSIFGTTFLYGIIFFILYLVIMIPMALLTVILSFLTIPLVYIFIGFYMTVMFTALPVQIFEGVGIGTALNKSFRLLKGHWWSSLGLLILLMLIYNVVIMVFAIPFYVSLFANYFTTTGTDLMEETPTYVILLNYLFGIIFLLGSFITYSVPLVGLTIQYFSLSEEKDATALMRKIDAFGTESTDNEEEEEYH